jgi:hypothetical protein
MAVWYAHRREDGSVASIHEELQPDYAEEAIDSASPELALFFAPRIPQEVTAAQLIRALDQLGDLAAVDAAVAGADALTQRLWARSGFFVRTDPLLNGIGQALGKSAADLDNLFRLAATL